jgi:hypothetical protein
MTDKPKPTAPTAPLAPPDWLAAWLAFAPQPKQKTPRRVYKRRRIP